MSKKSHHGPNERANEYKRAYGISWEERDLILASQGLRCKICRADKPDHPFGWQTDHDHRTGVVRGILCSRCNVMLGMAKDNPDILRAGATYLEK